MTLTAAPAAYTQARRTFGENTKSIFCTLLLQIGALDRFIEESGKIIEELERLQSFVEAGEPATAELQGTEVPQMLRRCPRCAHRFEMEGVRTIRLWQVVMLVTCVEAYLQDVLCLAASVKPDLMIKPEAQPVPYAEVVKATSLEDLASNVRAQWARRWVDNSGPTRWIERLYDMGAKDRYPEDLAPRLELIWGIRHVVVHRAGAADADFVRLHPGFVEEVGDRVRVSFPDLNEFGEAAHRFVELTDEFFLNWFPSLQVAPAALPDKH